MFPIKDIFIYIVEAAVAKSEPHKKENDSRNAMTREIENINKERTFEFHTKRKEKRCFCSLKSLLKNHLFI